MAKYPYQSFDLSSREYAKLFEDFVSELRQETIERLKRGTSPRELRAMENWYVDRLAELKKDSEKWIRKNLPPLFEKGDKAAEEALKKMQYTPYASIFYQPHSDAILGVLATMNAEIRKALEKHEKTFAAFIDRIQQSPAFKETVRKAVTENVLFSQTRQQLTQKLLPAVRGLQTDLADQFRGDYARIMVGNKRMRIDSYAELLARTEMRVAYSRGTESRLLGVGIDLVVISTHNSPCKRCGPLEGKVFSLSGKDETFPSIAILPNNGTPFHPNCLHSEQPFIVEFATQKEIKDAILSKNAWVYRQHKKAA